MIAECMKEVRCHGYIATRRTARKGHKCTQCGMPIEPKEEYYEVVRGGGGLGWLKFPERVHIDCLGELLERP